jgi:RNA polymerase sigma-70 factor (ECF subfamily)
MDIDDELAAIARLQRGDIGGLEPLVRRYHPRAVRCAYLVVHEHALALDIAQTAFVRAFERIRQFDARRPFAPWFFKLVLRDARKAAERRARTAPASAGDHTPADTDGGPRDPDPGPEDLWAQRELAQTVLAALAELPPAERVAIVQRYYLGLSEVELAAAAQAPLGTIKWRLHAARQRLRPVLEPISAESEVVQ